eukprot:scaffold43208_cov74-Phaeocystis_antarctica.AAC.8
MASVRSEVCACTCHTGRAGCSAPTKSSTQLLRSVAACSVPVVSASTKLELSWATAASTWL